MRQNGHRDVSCSVLLLSMPVEYWMDSTLAAVVSIYSNFLQQNSELIFDISLEISYENISLKSSEYTDICSLNQTIFEYQKLQA